MRSLSAKPVHMLTVGDLAEGDGVFTCHQKARFIRTRNHYFETPLQHRFTGAA
jgi:hypothetical protein